MANTSDISRGMVLNLEGSLYTVVEFGENKTARAAAKVWAKLKGVDNNRSIENVGATSGLALVMAIPIISCCKAIIAWYPAIPK